MEPGVRVAEALQCLAPRIGGNLMPSLGACLLALGNPLCPLTWWICIFFNSDASGAKVGAGSNVGGGSGW